MRETVVELAQSARTAVEFETRVLEELRARVGCDVAFFTVRGLEAEPTVLGLPPETIERAARKMATYGRELSPVKRAALAARGVAVDTQVLGVTAVRKTAYYNELARTVGGKHSLMAYVPVRGTIAAAVMLGRTSSHGFSHDEIQAVESLLPALGVARGSFGFPVTYEPLPSATPTFFQKLGVTRERLLASRTLRSGTTVSVRDSDGFREMLASTNDSELVWTRAALGDPARSGWPYVELFHVAAAVARHRRRALFVGSGGAVALRQFAQSYPGVALELVEHEPAVVELARAWFSLDSIPNLATHVADGVDFVAAASPASWDIAVIDAYDSEIAAGRFADPSFFAALHGALRPGGAAAFNVIGALAGGPVARVTRAARAVFDDVRLVPVVTLDEPYSSQVPRNVVVIAARRD
jgi:hypothetical protein